VSVALADPALVERIRKKLLALNPRLSERLIPLWAVAESREILWGRVTAAEEAMRRIIVEAARLKAAVWHEGGRRPEQLDQAHRLMKSPEGPLELDDGLTQSAATEPRKATLVELRSFAGLSVGLGGGRLWGVPGHGLPLVGVRTVVAVRRPTRRKNLRRRERP
jgi:hypothetical protein